MARVRVGRFALLAALLVVLGTAPVVILGGGSPATEGQGRPAWTPIEALQTRPQGHPAQVPSRAPALPVSSLAVVAQATSGRLLAGRVVGLLTPLDPAGAALPGVRVVALARGETALGECTTGRDGRFMLPLPADLPELVILEATAEGWTTARRLATEPADADGLVVLKMVPRVRLRIQVVDDHGSPADAQVHVGRECGRAPWPVDRDGPLARFVPAPAQGWSDLERFEARASLEVWLDQGYTYTLAAWGAAGEARVDSLLAREGELELRLRPTWSLNGTVCSDGAPMAEAYVTLHRDGAFEGSQDTGLDGRFSFGALAPGRWTLVARGPDGSRHAEQALELGPGGGERELRLVCETASGRLEVEVTGADPAGGHEVWIVDLERGGGARLSLPPSGRRELDLPPGPYRVELRTGSEDLLAGDEARLRAGERSALRFEAPPGALSVELGGVEGAVWLLLEGPGGAHRRLSYEVGPGPVQVRDLVPGRWELFAWLRREDDRWPGLAGSGRADVPSSGVGRAAIELHPVFPGEAEVRDDAGLPRAGVAVSLRRPGWASAEWAPGMAVALTDALGRCPLPPQPDGGYELLAGRETAGGFIAASAPVPLEVRGGRASRAVLVLPR